MKNIQKYFSQCLSVVALSALIIGSLPYSSLAATPPTINTQIRLRNAAGVAITTATTIQFSVYGSPSAGTSADAASVSGPLLWKETYNGSSGNCPQITPDSQGYFNVALGSCVAFPSYLTFNTTSLFLGIKVASDAEMSPRLSLGSAPFALNAQTVNGFSAYQNATANGLLALNSTYGFDIGSGAYAGGYLGVVSTTATSTFAGNLLVNGFSSFAAAAVGGGLTLASSSPASVANTLYNMGGSLYWNGSPIGTASSAAYTGITWIDATSTNLFSTNLVTTNNTTTNFFAQNATTTNLGATNLIAQNATTTNFNTTNFTAQNGTTTNFNTTNLTAGNATTTNNQYIGGNLSVNGTTNLNTTTVSNLTVTNTTTFNGPAVLTGFAAGSVLFVGANKEISESINFVWNNTSTTLNLNGGLTLASTTALVTSNTLYNQSGVLYWNGSPLASGSSSSFTNLVVNNATSTNLVTTNNTTTNFFAQNATTTNLGATNFTAQNATTTNLNTTNLVAQNATTTNLNTTNLVAENATTTNNQYVGGNLSVNGTTNLNTTTISNLTVTNTTTFNGPAVLTGFNAGSILFAGQNGQISQSNAIQWNTTSSSLNLLGSLVLASTTPSSTSNALYNQSGILYWNGSAIGTASSAVYTDITWINATSTNLFSTNLVTTNNTTTNFFAQNATTTNLNVTNFVAQNATTTNFNTANFVAQNATTTGSQYINGNLVVNGNTTLNTSTISNLTVSNTSTFNGPAVLAGFTAGSVLFVGPGSEIAQRNSQFFWDNTNSRLGLGTTTPANLLSLNGAISLASTSPATTSEALYNQSGNLYWNGFQIPTGNSGNFINLTSTNFFATNATTTNLGATNVTAQNATTTNLNSTNFVAQNATTTNLNTTNLVAQNATSTNQFTTNLTWQNATGTNTFLTNATSTNHYITSLVAQNATTTGNQYVGGDLTVNGYTTLNTTTALNLTITNTTTFNGPAILTGFSAGSVLFVGSDLSISERNQNFFWNNTLYRLGIGTNTPAAKMVIAATTNETLLDITSTTGESFVRVQSDGKVGISTTTPVARLAVAGKGSDDVFDASPTNGTPGLRVKADGKVGIGTTTPATALQVVGSVANIHSGGSGLVLAGITSTSYPGVGYFGGSSVVDIKVVDKIAYVLSGQGTGLSIFDISSSSNPRLISTTSVAYGRALDVSGKYLYIAKETFGEFVVYNIISPASPQLVATINTVSPGSYGLATVRIMGKYAITTDFDGQNIFVIDVSDPTNPQVVATSGGQLALSLSQEQMRAGSLAVYGNYLFGALYNENQVNTIQMDFSPVTIFNDGIINVAKPRGIDIAGNYLYVTSAGSSTLNIYDISAPTVPVFTGSVPVDTEPRGVRVTGNYAYISHAPSISGVGLTVVDTRNPAIPKVVKTYSNASFGNEIWAQPQIAGGNIYIGGSDNTLASLRLDTTEVSNFIAHAAAVGGLQADELSVGGELNVKNSVQVGRGGIMTDGQLAISDIYGSSYFGGTLGVGTSTPNSRLQVIGDVRVGTSGTNGCLQRFDGTALAGTCVSDQRLKKDIQPIQNILEKLVKLTPSTYKFRADEFPELHFGNSLQYGLIAQEVEKELPELVEHNVKDGFMGINYHMLPIYLLGGLKEVDVKVEDVKKTVSSSQSTLNVALEDIRQQLARATSTLPTLSTSTVLNYLQNATLDDITIRRLTVIDSALFKGSITVQDHAEFGVDTVGQAQIKAGALNVDVKFAKSYSRPPVVVAVPVDFDGAWKMGVSTKDGFSIRLITTSTVDTLFNWYAFQGSSAMNITVGETPVTTVPLVVVPPVVPAPVDTTSSLVTPSTTVSSTPDTTPTTTSPGEPTSTPVVGGSTTTTEPVVSPAVEPISSPTSTPTVDPTPVTPAPAPSEPAPVVEPAPAPVTEPAPTPAPEPTPAPAPDPTPTPASSPEPTPPTP